MCRANAVTAPYCKLITPAPVPADSPLSLSCSTFALLLHFAHLVLVCDGDTHPAGCYPLTPNRLWGTSQPPRSPSNGQASGLAVVVHAPLGTIPCSTSYTLASSHCARRASRRGQHSASTSRTRRSMTDLRVCVELFLRAVGAVKPPHRSLKGVGMVIQDVASIRKCHSGWRLAVQPVERRPILTQVAVPQQLALPLAMEVVPAPRLTLWEHIKAWLYEDILFAHQTPY
jgi:hypothetical protein